MRKEGQVTGPVTAAEYGKAVAAACRECDQEIAAATVEYEAAVRPITARRKQRGQAARDQRDQRIASLRKTLRGKEAGE